MTSACGVSGHLFCSKTFWRRIPKEQYMKSLVFSIITLLSMSAFAAPNIIGTYSCSDAESGETMRMEVLTIKGLYYIRGTTPGAKAIGGIPCSNESKIENKGANKK